MKYCCNEDDVFYHIVMTNTKTKTKTKTKTNTKTNTKAICKICNVRKYSKERRKIVTCMHVWKLN